MRVAVLGTGIMGGPIARRLADAGHVVRAWNRTPERAEGCCSYGAHFIDDKDRRNTEAAIAKLQPHEWQFHKVAAKKGVTRVGVQLRGEVERAARLGEEAKAWLESDNQRRKDAVENRREAEHRRAEEELAKKTAAAEERLGAERKRVEEMYPPMLARTMAMGITQANVACTSSSISCCG